MDDKIQKWTKKLNYEDRGMAEDILEVVGDIKQTVTVLENIAKRLQAILVNNKNNTKRSEEETYGRDSNQEDQNHLLFKCILCSDAFQNISELEKHIQENHKEYETFECETCSKNFVSKFRLKKHEKMHLNAGAKSCHYFRRNKPCPFERLGCKFRHEQEKIEENTVNGHRDELEETAEVIIEDDIPGAGYTVDTFDISYEIDDFDISLESTLSFGSFHASTPKKTYPCEQCEKGSECMDCFVVHILGRHDIARAAFPRLGLPI